MLLALSTLLLWTFAGFGSSRCAKAWGSLHGNLARLGLASLPMLLLALLFGDGLFAAGWLWFALSGVCHLGLGDLGLYGAYRRLGPRLGLLVCVCAITPITALIEWLWLGNQPTVSEGLAALVILVGVALALAPKERSQRPELLVGLVSAVLGAVGQALGAVATRRGYLDAGTSFGVAMDAACWRVVAGAAVLALVALVLTRPQRKGPAPWRWLALAVIAGPIIGIPAYQGALATAPSAMVVQAILTGLPVTVIPLAMYFDGDRPSLRSFAGALVAISGLVAMILSAARGAGQ